ncbi:unnamed protein product [Rotaria sp. Silwood2]|nr:unnamed protein product [Rotaria sp. Silwood2]CAF4106126.1 unnamed protein product [Rotaria sp. Silwood2]
MYFWYALSINSQNVNIETQIINTLHDLNEHILKTVDFTQNSKYVNVSFSYSYSKEIRSIIDMIMKDNTIILVTSFNKTSIRLSINESNFEISNESCFVIENMPCCDFNETVEKYIHEFIIGYFGYTYIKEVQLGGIIQQTIVITQNDRINLEKNGFNISNHVWMRDVAKELFSIQMKLNRTQTYDKMLMNISNKYFTKRNVMIYGGNISIKSFDDWYKSVLDNPVLVKFSISTIFELLTNGHFPTDSYIVQKAALIKLAVDRYLSNRVYCYNQCTDTIHGTCIDSGFFQFGICQCKSMWTGFDRATPIPHYIDTLHNSVLPIWKTRAGRNSYPASIGYGKGGMIPTEKVSNIFDHNIHTKYRSFGSGSNNIMSQKTGLNTGFYLTLNAGICIVSGFQFTTATSHPNRDPIMITLEGSNADKSLLTFGISWSLIYNGSSGLESDPGRGKRGVLQIFNNSQLYRSYRLLVVLKRGVESGVHYSEFAFYGHSCLPESHRRTENMVKIAMTQTTSAYMTVTSDYSQPLISTTSINMNMKNTFPNQTIEAGRTSSVSYISSGTGISQSYFDIAYRFNTMMVNMGQGTYVTNVNFSGPEGHIGVLLPPTKPFSKDIDYVFYFFGGPGILPPLINSFIAANLPAIVAYVSTNSLSINLDDAIKLTIKNLDLTPQSIYCSYAALSPVDYQENNLQWYINMILNLNGKIFASIMYHGMSMDFNVTLSAASMLMQTTINISEHQGFSCIATRLAFSIQSFSINNEFVMLLKTFFSTWYNLIDTPYHLASTLNMKYNSIIVNKLNIAISNLINTTLIQDIFNMRSMPNRTFHKDIYKIKQTETDYSRWMSTPKIQSKTLSQLKIPGTHNSGSYGLPRKLSQIIYGNIKFLWSLSADTALTNGQLPFSKDKIYVGRILLDYVLETALRISISQNRTIRQQLNDGIRFFDLRIYYDTDGSFYIQHGLRGPELNDVLHQVKSFLDIHSTSGELIFLSISHTNFGIDPEILPAKVTTIIQNNLKSYLYMPANSVGVKNFDFQSLKDITLFSITTTRLHSTSPKVIILNIDNSDDYYYKDTVVNTRGFGDSGRWTLNSNGVNIIAELIKLEDQGLKKNKKAMYQISWTQTPQIMDIIQNVVNHLNGNVPTMLLKQLALKTNSVLREFLTNHTTSIFNLITMD